LAQANKKEMPAHVTIVETDEEKVSSTSEEDDGGATVLTKTHLDASTRHDASDDRPREKLPSNGLSNETEVRPSNGLSNETEVRPSNGLSNETEVSGFTWGELRPNLQDKNARLSAIISGLTK